VGGTDCGANDCRFTDRCIDDPLRPKFIEKALGDFEGATVYANVLAEHEYPVVTPHFLGHRIANCLEICRLAELAHGITFTWVSASP